MSQKTSEGGSTLNIPSDLKTKLKIAAAQSKTTMQDFVRDALNRAIEGKLAAVSELTQVKKKPKADSETPSPESAKGNSDQSLRTITPSPVVISATLIQAATDLAAVAPPALIDTTAAMLRAMSGALIDEKGNSDQAGRHGSVRIEPDADAMRREVGELAAATGEGAQGDEQTG